MQVESYRSLHFPSTPAGGGTCLSGEGSGESGLESRPLDSCHCWMKKGDGFLEGSKGERRERRGRGKTEVETEGEKNSRNVPVKKLVSRTKIQRF